MKRRGSEVNNADNAIGSYSSDDGELMIDMSPRKPKRLKSTSKSSKRIKKLSENAESECELEKRLQTLKMNNHLEYTAVKNNLTVANVRNILKRVVSNEHVLAIVKLKESEEQDEDEEDNPLHKIPTLTRSKAKELQQKDLPVVWPLPVSPVQLAPSEVAVLINQELPEDSSDEEYQPHDDSDDDKESATISDLDSLPRTPASPPSIQETRLDEFRTNWTDDGLFKIPQQSSTEEQNIAKRTRSKLCLSSTNIETIEKAFVPPDITSDMYDFDDIDGVWKDFLNEFTEPLPQIQDDDEDTDPEYSVQVDDIPVDKEELREDPEVKVSRRELSDLVAELFDMDSIVDSGICNGLTDEQHNAISSLDLRELTQGNDNLLNPDEAEIETEVNSQAVEARQIDQFVQATRTEIITPGQRLILSQQLRQHVQLSTQHFLQLYGHPELWALADTCKQNLIHMLSLADNNPNSMFMAHNLKEAVDLCESWQQRLSKDNDETKSIYEFISSEIFKARTHKISHNRYYCQFPTQMMDVICNSKVFIYPELLPRIPFRLDLCNGGMKEFSPSEEEVLAIELSLFYKYVADNPQLYKPSKKRLYTLTTVVELMKTYFHNGRSVPALINHIRNRNLKAARDNPIKYFFMHKKPPPTTITLIQFDESDIRPPRLQPKEKLPHIWREHISNPRATTSVKARKNIPCFTQNKSVIASAIQKNYKIIVENSAELTEKDVTQIDKKSPKAAKVNSKSSSEINYSSSAFVANFIPPSSKGNILPTNCLRTISHNSSTPTAVSSDNPALFHANPNLTSESRLPVLYSSNISNTGFGFINPSNLICPNPISMPFLTFISTPTKNAVLNGNTLNISPIQSSFNNVLQTVNTVQQNDIENNYKRNSPIKNTSTGFSNNLSVSSPCKNSPLKVINLDNNKQVPCQCKCTCFNDKPIRGQKLLTEYFKPRNYNARKFTQKADFKGKVTFKIIWKFQLQVHEYFLNILNSLHLIYNVNYKQRCIKDSFIHLLALDFFLSLYFPNMLPSMPSLMTPTKQDREGFEVAVHATDIFSDSPKRNLHDNADIIEKEKLNVSPTDEYDDNGDDAEDIRKVKICAPKLSLAERRRQKSAKESKLVHNLWTKQPDLDYDISYAQLYYERVQERLNAEEPDDLKKFHDIVQSVTNGEDPSDVYRKLEILFLPNHPDLLEQFLTFLLPGQAAKVGKFMEHFLISNMDKFVKMINVYFFKQPAQIRKIYTALSELSDIPDVSMDDVKLSILPLLKGNPLLIEWFLQLFPNEKPPECDLSDFERLDLDKMDSGDMFDHVIVPEENDDPYGGDNCICKCHDSEDEKYKNRYLHCIPCGMKYIQGRVYIQMGKRLRPATVSFDDSLPMSVHVKRLSAKAKPHKRRADGSPSKLLLSPNKGSGSGSDDHRLDITTDNEEDSKKSPRKNSKLYKSTHNKCRNKKDFSVKECIVDEVKDDETRKSIESQLEVTNMECTDTGICNSSAPDSTDSLPILCTEDNIAPICASNNIQVNVCDSTETDVDVNNDLIESNSDALQVIIPSDELNVSLESEDKVSPGSVASSDISAGSDSDVSVHSEKSDLIYSDSDSSSIDDTEENSNDSDIADTFAKDASEDIAEEQNDDLGNENNSPEHNETSDEEEVESSSDPDQSDSESKEISNSDSKNSKTKIPEEEKDSKTWTRDEDKIILQTFQEQCDFDSALAKICELLPHKNMMDVKNRFQVLLNVLKKISAQD